MPTFVREGIRLCIEKRIDAFDKGYRQNVGLVGPLGTGKSFLLESFVEAFSGQGRFIPMYVHAESLDFDNLVERWIGAMLTGVFLSREIDPPENFQSLLKAADPIIPKTMERVRHLKRIMRREKNAATLRELFSLTGVLTEETGKKVILMIDEFHALESIPASDPFAILGREVMIEKNTLYLLASSHKLRVREIFNHQLSLLFGNFELLQMEPFDFSETVAYLRARLPAILFSPDQLRFLIQMTDGIPKYLDLMAIEIESRCSQEENGVVQDQYFFDVFRRQLFDRGGALSLYFFPAP